MIDEFTLERIQNVYSSMTPNEQIYLRRIVEEIVATGESETYDRIWLSDYSEIPVDITTFITHPQYLGPATRNGDAIYPYWKEALKNIFDSGNRYNEIVFTGATRIGKTSTAITGACYMLYRLMCLTNPQAFFNKKEVSKFSILFFNVTKDLAKGVAYTEFNSTLQASPWFNAHGHFSRSEQNPVYIPDGGNIIINYGSDASHALGQQVFCVVGSTQIIVNGEKRSIEELSGQTVDVLQYGAEGLEYGDALIGCTDYVSDTIEIELEDGTIIEGTPNHQVMLSDGTYKRLDELNEDDDLFYFENTCELEVAI